jgi:hypothetical protein
VLLILTASPCAQAWDSGTHRLITRLAIGALPPSPLRQFMSANGRALQERAVFPDSELKRLYGEAEKRRHYIDLEIFGPHPLDALEPDARAMERRFGARRLMRAGTLPWTIEEMSARVNAAWESGDCRRVLTFSGYLSHYVGDLSQPLHTTESFDGDLPSDRWMHARIELAVDRSTRRIEKLARPSVHTRTVRSVWEVVVDGLRQSHALVEKIEAADRYARDASGGDSDVYRTILMHREGAMIAAQIADSASRLASLWQYDWERAGSSAACVPRGLN